MVVVAKKSGKPRRTVDLSPLNKHYLMKTNSTEVPFFQVSCVKPGTFKSVLNAWNGYHAVELEEDSRNLTSFITPFGTYRYRRVPQGQSGSGDASYISGVDKCFVNKLGSVPAEDQAVTIPELAPERLKDEQYKAVMEAIPEKEEKCTQQLLPFFKIRHNIAIINKDNLVILAYQDSDSRTRLVIPRLLRSRVKTVLHADHRRDLVRVKM